MGSEPSIRWRLLTPRALRLFAALVCSLPVEAAAQGASCVLRAAQSPARQVLHCRDGLTIEAEAGADYTLVDSNRDGRPDAALLRARALLVDGPAASGRRGFRILTPQAVAAVRGTRWVADVAADRTSVFVISGRVFVRAARLSRGVNLGPGQGVDVEPQARTLTVKRWPAERVSALLARFGR